MPKRTQLSEAEREQRRAADRAFVQQAVEQLRSSEGWQRWLATRRHFHSYSLRNQLPLAMQKLASHCLLERDGCPSGPTAAQIRAAAPRRDRYDFRGIRSHLSWTECHGTATAPDRLNYRSPEGCGEGGTGAAPGGAPQGRASRWPRTSAVSPTPSTSSDAPVTANASPTPASNCFAPTAGSAGSAPAPATDSAATPCRTSA